MKLLYTLLILLVVLYFATMALLYLKQRDLLYFPSAPITHNFETMQLNNQGEQITITITNPGKDKALLYWGGNGEAVAAGADVFAEELPEYTTYLVDYRGYGRSSGTPTQEGILGDALALYDTVQSKHRSISLFGRSLGTGVASYVAAKRKTDKLALITPYDSILSVAKDRYPIFPLSLLVKDTYDSVSLAPQIRAQTIILIAEHDTVVPKEHAYRLAEAFDATRVEIHEIPGSHHNDIAQTHAYHQLLGVFFNER